MKIRAIELFNPSNHDGKASHFRSLYPQFFSCPSSILLLLLPASAVQNASSGWLASISILQIYLYIYIRGTKVNPHQFSWSFSLSFCPWSARRVPFTPSPTSRTPGPTPVVQSLFYPATAGSFALLSRPPSCSRCPTLFTTPSSITPSALATFFYFFSPYLPFHSFYYFFFLPSLTTFICTFFCIQIFLIFFFFFSKQPICLRL